MKLDFLTLYIVILLNSLTVAIIWGAIAYRYRNFAAARVWLGACVLSTIGGSVLALQGNEGSYVPAVVGNGFVILSQASIGASPVVVGSGVLRVRF